MTSGFLRTLGPAHQIMFDHAISNNLTLDDLTGRRKHQPLARVRQDCMTQIHRDCGMSTVAVGRLFGRHHTTVMHAISASKERAEK